MAHDPSADHELAVTYPSSELTPPEVPPASMEGSEVPATGPTTADPPDSAADSEPSPPARRKRGVAWLAAGALMLGVGGPAVWFTLGKGWANHHLAAGSRETGAERPYATTTGAVPVNTVRPRHKTLERTLTQPGSVRPWAQAELYAKVSGYLRRIQRDLTPPATAQLAGQMVSQVYTLAGNGTLPPGAVEMTLGATAQAAWWQAPQKDIGSEVRAGEVLLDIDCPERLQDIVEKETLVEQREAELASARTAVATLEAMVEAAKAQRLKADTDIRKSQFDLAFRTKEFGRIKSLVQDRTTPEENLEEKQQQVNAAQVALESSQVQAQVAQADLAVVSSKLATARADLRVKETLVRAARDELQRERILADFTLLHAPFDGLITYRNVDEGDFVQNASSGQTRLLMTVTALDKVKVVLQVPERDAVWVEVGADATLELDAHALWRGKGRVSRIGHVLDSQARTMQVEIDLENPGRRLKPGMYGQVTLTLQKIPDAQALPATAVYSRRGVNYVLLVEDGVVRRQPVRLRYDDGKEVEVVKLLGDREVPLDGTEEVVVSNKGEISDGQRVATSRLTGP